MKIFKRPSVLSGAFLTVLGLAWTEASLGYDQVCAYIMPGAGISGEMRAVVKYTPPVFRRQGTRHEVTLYSDWSGSYPIGQMACQDIPRMYDPALMKMEEYSIGVEFRADYGSVIRCDQFITDPLRRDSPDNSYQFNIWGTTQYLYCNGGSVPEQWKKQPTPANPDCPCECDLDY